MIAIIDYDAGNLKSVEKAIQFLGEDVIASRDKEVIKNADKVILPGVGNFGDCMDKLKRYDLIDTINEVVDKKTPFLGICLGLQLLFKDSEEAPGVAGLGILPGKIVRIPEGEGLKIPHIGWNSLALKNNGRLFNGLDNESFVYFVHSYYLKVDDESIVKATTNYGVNIDASVEKDNVFACQFHPEKSGDVGLKILSNFASI
jgi:glutamine amidotransferase